MKLKIITVGIPKLSFAKEGNVLHLKRLGGYHIVDVVYLSDVAIDDKILVCLMGFCGGTGRVWKRHEEHRTCTFSR